MILLQQMLVFFLIMLLGYGLAKKDVLDPATTDKISWLIVNVCNPAIILSGALSDTKLSGNVVRQTVWVAIGMYAILIIIGRLMPYLLMKKECKTYELMTVFGNIGYMGFPIISAMFGQKALILVTIFVIAYNVLIYSYGIIIISPEGFSLSSMRKVLNIGTLACVLAIIIYATNLELPAFLSDTIIMISDTTAPLSMLVIGTTFVGLSLKSLFMDLRMLIFSAIRLIVIPLSSYGILRRVITDPTLLGVCVIMLSVPVGSITVMIAKQYGGDVETNSKGIAITTALSVVTMPLVFAILSKP